MRGLQINSGKVTQQMVSHNKRTHQTMTKPAKIFLTCSIVAFGFGCTPWGANLFYGVAKPIGALAFIAFFIVQLTAKEMAAFDEEERLRAGRYQKAATPQVKPSKSSALVRQPEDVISRKAA